MAHHAGKFQGSVPWAKAGARAELKEQNKGTPEPPRCVFQERSGDETAAGDGQVFMPLSPTVASNAGDM